MIRRVRTLLLFLIVPGVAALAPLLLYPSVVTRFGASGFAALAIAQSLGVAAGVICELGWSVVGPQAIPRRRHAERSELHAMAFATKVMALFVGLPVVGLLASSIAIEFRSEAALIACSTALAALSPSWILTGLNKPGLILLVETLPRVFLTVAAALLIAFGAPLWVIAIANTLTIVVSLAGFARATRLAVLPTWAQARSGPALARQHLPLTFGRAVSVLYTSLLTAIVGAVLPSAVALFAATDRLLRMGLLVLAGIPARLQSWVGADPDRKGQRRSRQSLLMNIGLGVVAAPAFYFLAPWAGSLFFVGEIPISHEAALIGASTVLVLCVSRGLGLSMVAEGQSNWIAGANVCAAVFGVTGVVLLVPGLGALGALMSALIAESAGVLWQAAVLFARPRRSKV